MGGTKGRLQHRPSKGPCLNAGEAKPRKGAIQGGTKGRFQYRPSKALIFNTGEGKPCEVLFGAARSACFNTGEAKPCIRRKLGFRKVPWFGKR